MEGHTCGLPEQPRHRLVQNCRNRWRIAGDVAAEAVADAMNRAYPGLPGFGVVDRVPDLVNQRLKAGLGHEGVRPQTGVDLFLGDDLGSAVEQEQQQVQGLSRQVHRGRTVRDGSSITVDTDGAERVRHEKLIDS